MFDIISHLYSLDISQLKEVQNLAGEVIASKLNKSSPTPHTLNGAAEVSNDFYNIKIDDFVEYSDNFISDDDKQLLLAELESLSLKAPPTSPDKVPNQFISLIDEPYIWPSKNGPVFNNPKKFDDFPVMKRILGKVNDCANCELNSVLVSRMATGNSCIRLHDDDEESMDPNSPICVVSIGTKRRVEFCKKKQHGYKHTDLALQPSDGSMYVMKKGCQKYFEHRVRKNKNIKLERFSLSFRRFVPANDRKVTVSTEASQDSMPQDISPPGPVRNLLNRFLHKSPEESQTPMFTTPTSTLSAPPNPVSTSSLTDIPDGFSPFDKDDTINTKSSLAANTSERLCVIFGTSITAAVDGRKMSRGSRRVINMSESGSKIGDIMDSVRDFCLDNPTAVPNVDKVILCLGTNDIKFFNSFRFDLNRRFRAPLTKLIKQVKLMFPSAQIIFKCVLPFRIMYTYNAKSVHEFNYLLVELCSKHGCIFMDCFRDFLDNQCIDHNRNLYRDKLHLNEAGLIVLCRAIKHIIYNNVYNPYMRTSRSNRFYFDG